MKRCLLLLLTCACLWQSTAVAAPVYTVRADNLAWDEVTQTLRAQGNVYLSHDLGWVQADSVTFHTDSQELTANGNVRWQAPEGQGNAEAIFLDLDDHRGHFFDGALSSPTGTRIWGEEIIQLDQETFELKNGGFTPCGCPSDQTPTWKITVKQATIAWRDWVRFRSGVFWGRKVPFLYFPGAVLPLLDSRQTGLLVPHMSYNSIYGFTIVPGFFLAMGPSADLTLWGTYTSDRGWGFQPEFRAASQRGRYLMNLNWFREFPDASFLTTAGRGARQRWTLRTTVNESPWGRFRLTASIKLISDALVDSDFAENLNDLTRDNTSSNITASREKRNVGSLIASVNTSQRLLTSAATGSRAPRIWLRVDPQALKKTPLWLSGDFRYDRFSAFDPDLGDSWQPKSYEQQAQRLYAGIKLGTEIDPLPGLFLKTRIGAYGIYRFLDEDLAAYDGRRDTELVSYIQEDARWQADFSTARATARVASGIRVAAIFSDSSTATNDIEDIDNIRKHAWLIPNIAADGYIKQAYWRYDLNVPYAIDSGLNREPNIAHQLKLNVSAFENNTRIWHRSGLDVTRFDTEITVRPYAGHQLRAGFGRGVTSYTATNWDLGLETPFTDGRYGLRPYREAFAYYTWKVYRFFGTIGGRRRYPLEDGQTAEWTERRVLVGYRDPCDCLSLTLDWRDLPAKVNDQIMLTLNLSLLGGTPIPLPTP